MTIRRRLVALAAATLALASAAGLSLTAAPAALAAGSQWTVGVTGTPASFTEGDGVQNVSSASVADTYTINVTNPTASSTSGTVTVSMNFQGSGVSLKSILPNVPTATGDVTTGSACIANVNVTTGPFVVGQPLSATGFSGATLVAVNGATCGANSLQASVNATSTGTGRTVTEPATATTPTGAGWTCTNASTPTCTRTDPLAPGSPYPPITVTVQVSATAGVGTATGSAPAHVTASTTVAGGGPGTTIVTSSTPVVLVPDLTATNTVNGAFRQGDSNDSYRIVVLNQGGGTVNPSSATRVGATVTLPSGETAVSLGGGGWTCNLTATPTPYNLPADSCFTTGVAWGYAAELPAITLVVATAPNATTPETQTVTVSGGGELVAPISTSYATTIQQSADLTATIGHGGSFNQGDSADTYSLTVKNVVGENSTVGGPSLGPVTVTDTLPVGSGVTLTGVSGAGWACTLAPTQIPVGNPNLVPQVATCTRSDALAVNASYPPITLTVAILNGAQSPQVSTVTVSGGDMSLASTGPTTGCPVNTLCTVATDSAVINPEPDLTVYTGLSTSNVSGNFTQGDGASSNDVLTITPYNVGFAPTSGLVTVTDAMPNGVLAQSAGGTGWICGVSSTLVTCATPNALPAGSSYPPISVAVTVAPNAPSSANNDVTIAGGGEINAANDHSNPSVGIAQLPDLAIVQSSAGAFAKGDTNDSFTIAVSNGGLAPTSGTVSVTDVLSSGLSASAISGSGWTCDLPSLTCTRADSLGAVNGTYPSITVTVAVSPTASGAVSSAATVSGGGEIYTANDTSVVIQNVPNPAARSPSSGGSPGSSGGSSTGTGSSSTTPGTGGASLAGLTAKPALSVHLALHGRRAYRVYGALTAPAGVARGAACHGSVVVALAHAGRTLAHRTVKLSAGCSYSISGTLAHARSGRTTATVSFPGNSALAPVTARRAS